MYQLPHHDSRFQHQPRIDPLTRQLKFQSPSGAPAMGSPRKCFTADEA
jgi:hypothetical protein